MTTDRNGAISKGFRRVARLDIPGGGQVSVRGNYAFVGHIAPPFGTSIIDISDPANPRIVHQIMLENSRSHTHKVRVVGDLMICNHEMFNRHFLRKGFEIPGLMAGFQAENDRLPTDAELAAKLGVTPDDIPGLRHVGEVGYNEGGFKVYNIADPSNPKLLSYQKTGGIGVHRFYADEDYAYISTEMDGFQGNILVNYDLARPDALEETSRWWMPGQNIAAGETPTWSGVRNRLHHALRTGDELWAACWYAGFSVIDASDMSQLRTKATHNYHPPFPEPTHTALKLPHKLGGRDIALVVDEEHPHATGQPHAFVWIFDVTDLNAIQPLSTYHVTDFDAPWARAHLKADGSYGASKGMEIYGPGAHQFQEHVTGDIIFCTFFSAGLRAIDIGDPLNPKELGYYIPPPAKGFAAPQSNDVCLDDRGLIYVIDRINGLDILEFQ
ncbi:MAG: hypothetical protein ACI80I_002513 [Akkermansiaceae bacterium]|jgi:hypothetical protein